MQPAHFVEHKGRQILLLDFSDVLSERVAIDAVEAARRFVAAQPKVQNLLTLVDVGGSVYTMAVVEAFKGFAVHNKPWVIASSIVGMSALRRLIVRLVCLASGRKIAIFRTREAAMDWLVQQKEPPKTVPEDWAEEDTIRAGDAPETPEG